ncbi:MAG: TIGR04283 family arsenosugar biosynthesis glycosyltransferase [Burkholderiales bacterium]|nr:TIGR04283 family arsenosugar biosynthesis glycosyltransferase [Burkholderiales bacterium]
MPPWLPNPRDPPSVKLSIIVPALNEAAGIVAALGALAPLRARGHEVIVVDGGSTDTTAVLARPLAERVIDAPRGRARQMNAGARIASGDVLVFLHADTLLPEGADRLIERALGAPDCAWGRFDVRIEGVHPLLPVVAAMMNLRSALTGIATGDQAIFVRRAGFAAVGGYPPIALMEDVALSRALARRARPARVRERAATSGRRWETRGVLRTIALMWWLRTRYFCGASPERLARLYDGG